MNKQEARDLLKGCGGCLGIILLLAVLITIWFAVGEILLKWIIAIPFAIIYYGMFALPYVLGAIVLFFIIYVIYSAIFGK